MKKIIPLIGLVVIGSLVGCSDDNGVEQKITKTGSSTKPSNVSSADTESLNEGVWSFCNDKQLTASTVSEGCQNIDTGIWQLNDGELTALVVDSTSMKTPKVECKTDCFDVNSESIETNVVAKGHYELDDIGYTFTIVESTDEAKYPLCTVRWDLNNKVGDDLVQWTFNDLNCGMDNTKFTAWAKKYVGEVN